MRSLPWVLVLLISVTAATAHAADSKKKAAESKKKRTVVVLSIGRVSESPAADDFPFGAPLGSPLKDVVARLRRLSKDEKVDGLALLLGGSAIGTAQIEEVRQALAEVRKAKKEIYVHASSLGMDSYTLAAGASHICVTPTGDVNLPGLYGERVYLAGLFKMLGVQPDFLACGDYKSAAEMFTRTGPSKAAQENTDWLFDSLFATYVKLIASGRKVEEKKVKDWIDEGVFTAESAKKEGIIDSILDRREFVSLLKVKYGDKVVFNKRYGKKKRAEIDLSSPFGLMKFYSDLLSGGSGRRRSTKPAIAIVYVDGAINTGSGGANPFSLSPVGGAFSTPIRKALYKAADDDSVKAVVLRVSSPGGSALASEIILRATRVVKAKKPLIVSMGNVAGSGGYYVAMAADTIFADAATITGSIGVVGGKISTSGMFKRVGVNFHATKRGRSAGLFFSGDPMTDDERARMRKLMHEVYDVFKKHVVEARGKKLAKKIDELAGGRVFTGAQALKLGLVDKLGTMQDAIAYAAKKASLKEYEIRVLPRPLSFIDVLLGDAANKKDNPNDISLPLRTRTVAPTFDVVRAALPHLEGLDPRRMSAVLRALQQLKILQRDGISLAMPELYLHQER